MNNWYMLTLVGEDRPGIVAKLTHALFEGGCDLGEASMMRLGGNFTIMLMVGFDGRLKQLEDLVAPVSDSLDLHLHVDHIKAHLHKHLEPDVRISVYGANRPGIVSEVTGALAEAGLHILDLESDVGGTAEAPIYIMTIEGHAAEGVDSLRAALEIVTTRGIDARLDEIETLIG
ncbi:MAG: ACT domain-containing protein [Granulosicoccaceae bacterium]|jgi:glycine cleavage system transcriptional repressor